MLVSPPPAISLRHRRTPETATRDLLLRPRVRNDTLTVHVRPLGRIGSLSCDVAAVRQSTLKRCQGHWRLRSRLPMLARPLSAECTSCKPLLPGHGGLRPRSTFAAVHCLFGTYCQFAAVHLSVGKWGVKQTMNEHCSTVAIDPLLSKLCSREGALAWSCRGSTTEYLRLVMLAQSLPIIPPAPKVHARDLPGWRLLLGIQPQYCLGSAQLRFRCVDQPVASTPCC
jgi:hypothetical protein